MLLQFVLNFNQKRRTSTLANLVREAFRRKVNAYSCHFWIRKGKFEEFASDKPLSAFTLLIVLDTFRSEGSRQYRQLDVGVDAFLGAKAY
jgi:hypothetical protein